ncbi:hypothetical protein WDU94_012977 [Cyamophila willieti]
MTPQDLLEWKLLVLRYQLEPFKLFQEMSKFWARFPPKPKDIEGSKEYLKRMLRDPLLITDPILSMEISMCNAMDDQYGPVIELYRRSLGLAHEAKVMSHLTECGIVFQSEKLSMALGFDKTPDVLVYPPVWVGDRPVHWIESKALFGNPENHLLYEQNQYIPYYERFGPGLVVYWFGFVDSIPPHTPEYMIVTNMPPRHLMKQPLLDGYNDPATFIEKFSHVIRVSVEEKHKRTGIEVGQGKGKTATNSLANQAKGVLTPSKLTSSPAKVKNSDRLPTFSPSKARSSTETEKMSFRSVNNPRVKAETLTNDAARGHARYEMVSKVFSLDVDTPTVNFADFGTESSVNVSSHCVLRDKLFEDGSHNRFKESPTYNETESNSTRGNPWGNPESKEKYKMPNTPKRLDRTDVSKPDKPCANLLNTSNTVCVEGNLACSTPLKHDDSARRSLVRDTDNDLSSSSQYDLSTMSNDLSSSSQYDLSTMSNCSMCDVPLTERSTCTKTPVCFSSRCSGKLLAFTAPCVCSQTLLIDKDVSLSDNDTMYCIQRNK